MTPDVNIMRQEVVNLYPKAEAWKKRVLAMADDQVTAIYFNRVASKEAEKKAREPVQEQLPF